eukprot:m.669253 g.669253  ORF g.669253 m.669253 type:complete len:538 (+) comp22760_c1_seq12:394-2007(+)
MTSLLQNPRASIAPDIDALWDHPDVSGLSPEEEAKMLTAVLYKRYVSNDAVVSPEVQPAEESDAIVSPGGTTTLPRDSSDDIHATIDLLNQRMDEQLESFDNKTKKSVRRRTLQGELLEQEMSKLGDLGRNASDPGADSDNTGAGYGDSPADSRLTSLGITRQEQDKLFENCTRSQPPGLNETVMSTVSHNSELSDIERDSGLNNSGFDLMTTQTQQTSKGLKQQVVTSFPTTRASRDAKPNGMSAVTVTNNAFDMNETLDQPQSPQAPVGTGRTSSAGTPSTQRPMSPNRRKKMLPHRPESRILVDPNGYAISTDVTASNQPNDYVIHSRTNNSSPTHTRRVTDTNGHQFEVQMRRVSNISEKSRQSHLSEQGSQGGAYRNSGGVTARYSDGGSNFQISRRSGGERPTGQPYTPPQHRNSDVSVGRSDGRNSDAYDSTDARTQPLMHMDCAQLPPSSPLASAQSMGLVSPAARGVAKSKKERRRLRLFKKGKGGVTKDMIGLPEQFRHVSHTAPADVGPLLQALQVADYNMHTTEA